MSQTTTEPTPVAEPWAPPTGDQEFTFEGTDSLPEWADKNWVSYDRGPALAVPAGDIFGAPPYTTKVARVGDTVKFIEAVGATPAHFEVIKGEIDPAEGGTKKLPQVSAASLEDMLKTGTMAVTDLGDDAKAQVVGRSPELKRLIEDSIGVPEQQPVGDMVKLA